MTTIGTDKAQDAYHSISTDHPLFEKLALSVFTTGSFIEFYNYQPPNSNEFVNRKYFGYGPSASPSFIFEPDTALPKKYESTIYNIVENNHVYVSDLEGNWNFRLKDESTLGGGDVPLSLFVDKASRGMAELNPGDFSPWTELQLDPSLGGGTLPMTSVFGNTGKFLATVIEMNNWSIHKIASEGRDTPMSEWTDEDGSWNQAQFRGVMGFLASIKSSKNNCLEWTAKVKFNLTPSLPDTDPNACIKEEHVNFKLRLFDHAVSRDSRNRIVQRGPLTNVGVPVREFGPRGKIVDGVPEDGRTETVQPLDVISDSISGKGRSGSLQCLAILSEELGPCTNTLNVDSLKDTNANDDSFDINAITAEYKPATAKAMPLQAQNKNPNQWTPVWRNAKCDDGTNRPTEIIVYNFAQRTYAKGTTVMLNQLGGSPPNICWAVIDFGADPEPPVSQTFEGRWDFTSLLANGNGFFRKFKVDGSEPLNQPYEIFTSDQYETEFRQNYYATLYSDTSATPEATADYQRNIIFDGSTPRALNFGVNGSGYTQITSWDFLHNSIGGTRGTHNSIGSTIAELHPKGITWAAEAQERGVDATLEDPSTKHGFSATPFFGPVFPDGYEMGPITGDGDVVDYRKDSVTFKALGDGDTKDLWNTSTPGSPFADSKCSQIDRAYNEGIFNTNIVNQNGKMIPADVALHSSPNGENGRPISNVAWIREHMTLGNINTDKYFSVGEADGAVQVDPLDSGHPRRYSWLSRIAVEGGKEKAYESWDLETQSRRVQFRPLLAETYLTFWPTNYGDLKGGSESEGGGQVLKNVLHMAERGQAYQDDINSNGRTVLGKEVYNRAPADFKEHQNPAGLIGAANLTEDSLPGIAATTDTGYGFPIGVHAKFSAAPFAHYTAGTYNNSIWGTSNTPRAGNPNAVGITSAVFTIKSVGKDSISFETNYNIGVAAKTNNTFGGAFNNMSLIIGSISASISVGTGPTFNDGDIFYWGGQDDPWSFNTTTCHAKVWQAWPRELTVYDSRFFVAHHFNNGLSDEGVDKYVRKTLYRGNKVLKNKDAVELAPWLQTAATSYGYTVAKHGESYIAEYLSQENILWSARDVSGSPVGAIANSDESEGWVGEGDIIYPVDQVTYTPDNSREYEVDFKEPTYSNKYGKTDNSLVPLNVRVFSDGPVRDKTEWRVNAKCRAKLLPFKHYRKTIGISPENIPIVGGPVHIIVQKRSDLASSNALVGDISNQIFVSDADQSGYVEGDRFTTSGGSGQDVILEVSSTDGAGGISMFKVINGGHGFAPRDFMKEKEEDNSTDRTFNVNSTSPVSLKPLQLKGLGKGFQGWIAYGMVIQIEVEHAKPAECGTSLISPSTKTAGQLTGTFRQIVSWNESKQSPDNKYDVMLWFHNDIAHTFQYHQDYNGYGTSRQQWITVNPLPE